MNQLDQIKKILQQSARNPESSKLFFKTGPGSYAQHDQFIGVNVPTLRTIAKQFANLPRQDLQTLLKSTINEERLLALLILVTQYQKGNAQTKDELYKFYLDNLQHVNNWNLVDASAHLIVGAQLLDQDKEVLTHLAQSSIIWERRVAIVATWYFIRHNKLEWTFSIATTLLCDKHDLIHKAVGWMLREAGKKDQQQLINFLDLHAAQMPRTMLRYALEKFPEEQRQLYLKK